ncbi:MAG: phosphopantothenate--cysteine ligase [Oscillospiraceae bacterium]|nr:phosphopantothenate--cysteine ligase [Oscillospiraceae bacterium]
MSRPYVLVTAGGTIEDIDTVRGITNHATGQLGCLIAEAFVAAGFGATYLCGQKAVRASGVAQTVTIRDTAGLVAAFEKLLTERDYACVVHSMAVSDFTPAGTRSLDNLAASIGEAVCASGNSHEDVAKAVRDALLSEMSGPREKKISSAASELVILLKQTPKAIGRVKPLAPNTLLVGFKLLSGVGEETLIAAGQGLIKQNNCDYVLLNDLDDITENEHKAALLGKDGIVGRANTKKEIADMIVATVAAKIGRAQ